MPLLGVDWLKYLPTIINKISLDENKNQSENIHRSLLKQFETNTPSKMPG